MKLKVGATAPDFTLPDQDEKEHTLSDSLGSWVLIFFYPKDMTPGCTKEACGIRDSWSQYRRNGIEVFGISADTTAKHKKFADKHDLPFTLLADPEKTVIKKYGVWAPKKFMGREFLGILRHSVLIDPEGVVAKVYEKVKVGEHAEEVLADKKALAKG